MEKSTRHAELLGKFGEYGICNWLSRFGFEVCVVNHTGLDIVAYDPKSKRRLGITVKSRARKSGTESESVNLLSQKKKDRWKLTSACESFGCEPWLAVYVECAEEKEKYVDIYLTSLANYDNKYKSKEQRAIDQWSMAGGRKKAYESDPEVGHIHFKFEMKQWPPLR